ncbi:MAG: hypothetical protein ABSF29_17140 [Tepidisphaeraceae bacterium]
MSLSSHLRRRLEQVLSTLDDDALGPRLRQDAVRLWKRAQKFVGMNLIGPETDRQALELACYALQLPPRQARGIISGKLGRTNLRERSEQAAELLVSLVGPDVGDELLDKTTRLLHEIPHRSPVVDEARLLADVLNLEDFGLTGLIVQTVQMALQGDGIDDLLVAAEKREEYGYWSARLKDGFHFEPIRAIARRRLETARQVVKMLADELAEDQP